MCTRSCLSGIGSLAPGVRRDGSCAYSAMPLFAPQRVEDRVEAACRPRTYWWVRWMSILVAATRVERYAVEMIFLTLPAEMLADPRPPAQIASNPKRTSPKGHRSSCVYQQAFPSPSARVHPHVVAQGSRARANISDLVASCAAILQLL